MDLTGAGQWHTEIFLYGVSNSSVKNGLRCRQLIAFEDPSKLIRTGSMEEFYDHILRRTRDVDLDSPRFCRWGGSRLKQLNIIPPWPPLNSSIHTTITSGAMVWKHPRHRQYSSFAAPLLFWRLSLDFILCKRSCCFWPACTDKVTMDEQSLKNK